MGERAICAGARQPGELGRRANGTAMAVHFGRDGCSVQHGAACGPIVWRRDSGGGRGGGIVARFGGFSFHVMVEGHETEGVFVSLSLAG